MSRPAISVTGTHDVIVDATLRAPDGTPSRGGTDPAPSA